MWFLFLFLVQLNAFANESIIISIGKEVPERECVSLLEKIQSILNTASDYFHEETNGNYYFKNVTVLVPSKWNHKACDSFLQLPFYTSRSYLMDATIHVRGERSISGAPFTTSPSIRCDVKGEYISVGYNFILNLNTSEVPGSLIGDFETSNSTRFPSETDYFNGAVVRDFLREWESFLYGKNSQLSSFVRGRVGTHWENCTRAIRSDAVENFMGPRRGENSCIFVPKFEEHYNNFEACQFSFRNLPNVTFSCHQAFRKENPNFGDPQHQNKSSKEKNPTYQTVYSQNEDRDFKKRKPRPVYTIKQVPVPTFIILTAMESYSQNGRDACKLFKYATRKFIRYDLPYNSRIGLLTCNQTGGHVLSDVTSLGSIATRRALVNKLLDCETLSPCSNPGFVLNLGISAIIDMLKRNALGTVGAVIILATPWNISTHDLKTSSALLREHGMAFASLHYPSNGSETGNKLISDSVKGLYLTIQGPDSRPGTLATVYIQLVNAFIRIQSFFSEGVDQLLPALVHQEEYSGDLVTHVQGNFSYKQTHWDGRGDFWILTSNPFNPKINSFELTSPTGMKYTTYSEFPSINLIGMKARINETGLWHYSFERLQDRKEPHFVQVVTKSLTEEFNMKLFTNAKDNFLNLSVSPLTLFVKILHLERPVVGANVHLIVDTGKIKSTVRLLDNGFGDPDILAEDGVYSGYFIPSTGETSETFWRISAKAIVNPDTGKILTTNGNTFEPWSKKPSLAHFCGHLTLIPSASDLAYLPAPFWERFLPEMTLSVTDVRTKEYYPPGPIRDLKVSNIYGNQLQAELLWTSPAHLFQGDNVAHYKVLSSLDNSLDSWKTLKTFHALKGASVEDQITVNFPSPGEYRIVIQGMSNGKVGQLSNIVRLALYPITSLQSANLPPSADTKVLGIKTGAGTPTNSSSTHILSRLILIGLILCHDTFKLF